MKSKVEPLVNLNINSCKLCMPITSYSLTEEEAVYGGSGNLKKGLKKLIKLYPPDIIGIMTTCLAETIGEDVPGILNEFEEKNPQYHDTTLNPFSWPGYGGSKYDGHFFVLHAKVSSIVRFMCECGILPVVCATGAACQDLLKKVVIEIEKLRNLYLTETYKIADEADVKDMEAMMIECKANVMVGNYKDTIIDTKEMEVKPMIDSREEEMKRKTLEHPCYNCKGHKFARIHLPVAPACNVQCKYCVRKFDCPNESRPGVTSAILTPEEGLSRYLAVKEKMPNLTVVGIAGPGEALENWESVKSLFEQIRAHDPKVTFCLSTNGLKLPLYAEELARLSVSHVTVTLNAIDPHISGQMYQYIRFMGKEYTGDAAGAIMVANQLAGIRLLIASGILVKVNIVTVKGINDSHVPEVVKAVKSLGCFITNIMQMIPVEGSVFEQVEPISNKRLTEIRKECEEIMPQMYHCQHCRADAVGTLTDDKSIELKGFLQEETKDFQSVKTHYRFAVASKSGVIVDTHFGHAKEFYLYDYLNGEVRFAGKKKVEQYCMGEEHCEEKEDMMESIMDAIKDCNGVIAMRIGMEPMKKLAELGIKPVNTYDMIEDAVKKAAATMQE